jgi:hypothetical protein
MSKDSSRRAARPLHAVDARAVRSRSTRAVLRLGWSGVSSTCQRDVQRLQRAQIKRDLSQDMYIKLHEQI